MALARDAESSGDRVLMQAFLQFAEHYFRVMNDSTDPEPLRPQSERRDGGNSQSGLDDEDEDEDEEDGGSYEARDQRPDPRAQRHRTPNGRESNGRDSSGRDRGSRDEALRGETQRNDGQRNETQRNDSQRDEGQRYEGQRREADYAEERRPRRDLRASGGERQVRDEEPVSRPREVETSLSAPPASGPPVSERQTAKPEVAVAEDDGLRKMLADRPRRGRPPKRLSLDGGDEPTAQGELAVVADAGNRTTETGVSESGTTESAAAETAPPRRRGRPRKVEIQTNSDDEGAGNA